MGSPRQEFWNGLPFPSPGDLPHPEMEPTASAGRKGSSPLSHLGSPWPHAGSLVPSSALAAFLCDPGAFTGAPSPPTGSLTLLTHFCSPAQPQTQTLTSGDSNIAFLWTFKEMSHALTTFQVLLTLRSTIQNPSVHFLPRFLNNEVPEGNDFSHVTGTQGLWQEPDIPLHKSKKTAALPPKL